MLSQSITYENDLPSRNINSFKNHRFLILVKNTGVVPKRGDIADVTTAKDSIGNPITGSTLETIDIVKQMGDLLPPEIARIINENRYEDPTDWFCKKFFAKPIAVETERKVAKSAAKDKEKDKERDA